MIEILQEIGLEVLSTTDRVYIYILLFLRLLQCAGHCARTILAECKEKSVGPDAAGSAGSAGFCTFQAREYAAAGRFGTRALGTL